MMTLSSLRAVLLGTSGFALAAGARAASLLLTGATLHTASGPVLTDASLLVRDGKIAAVGARPAEAADQVIDLKGQHVFPASSRR